MQKSRCLVQRRDGPMRVAGKARQVRGHVAWTKPQILAGRLGEIGLHAAQLERRSAIGPTRHKNLGTPLPCAEVSPALCLRSHGNNR
jgi:hypothetical protein